MVRQLLFFQKKRHWRTQSNSGLNLNNAVMSYFSVASQHETPLKILLMVQKSARVDSVHMVLYIPGGTEFFHQQY